MGYNDGVLCWEMEYNTSGIRTKRVSDETTYSYMPKQHMLCKILPQHMIPGVLGFQGFFLRSGDSFHNASPFKPCKLPKKQEIQFFMLHFVMWIVLIVNGIHMHILIGHTMAYGSLYGLL